MHKWRICPIFQLKAISYYDIHLSNSPALCIMLVYSPHENGTSTPELHLTELQFKNCSKLKLGVEFIPVIFWYAQIHAVMGDHNRIISLWCDSYFAIARNGISETYIACLLENPLLKLCSQVAQRFRTSNRSIIILPFVYHTRFVRAPK